MRCVLQHFVRTSTPHSGSVNQPPPFQTPTTLNVCTPIVSISECPFSVSRFLIWANDISPLIGLQAYRCIDWLFLRILICKQLSFCRMLVELLYRQLRHQLELILQKQITFQPLDKNMLLGSYRSFPGKYGNVTVLRKRRMSVVSEMPPRSTNKYINIH